MVQENVEVTIGTSKSDEKECNVEHTYMHSMRKSGTFNVSSWYIACPSRVTYINLMIDKEQLTVMNMCPLL